MHNNILSSAEIIDIAKQTIDKEVVAMKKLTEKLGNSLPSALEAIVQSKGRLIITGIGKSAIIAMKITATLNSTGTPSIFMHSADAIHGDLGNIQPEDIAIIISKSGNTPEIKALVPLVKGLAKKTIAIVGNAESYLAKNADYVLDVTVDREACPNNLAPTTSTTAQMVMGDVLAVCLMRLKGFDSQDFAKYHPGGALGKRLYMKVSDIIGRNEIPAVYTDSPIRQVITEISSKRLGVTAVLNDEKQRKLVGVITDGDIRRMLEKNENIAGLTSADVMGKSPKTIGKNAMAVEAYQRMENFGISNLLVTDGEEYCGVIHLHDLLREGIL